MYYERYNTMEASTSCTSEAMDQLSDNDLKQILHYKLALDLNEFFPKVNYFSVVIKNDLLKQLRK